MTTSAMSHGDRSGPAAAAVLFDDDGEDVPAWLEQLRARPDVVVVNGAAAMEAELAGLLPPLTDTDRAEPGRWAWYEWRRELIWVPGPGLFRRLRLDRNRNKITTAEQEGYLTLTVGIVGLSVGHCIAHTLALEGLCGRLRLADNDTIALSNLNRIPATVMDIGTNKAVVVARRIAELDPYLPTEVFTSGLTEACMDEFFTGLDVVIEECDSLDMKVRVRQEARSRGIPVFMETSDRGLFDVERFDAEPGRPLFHGLLGDVDPTALRGLSTHDKGPYVMQILQTAHLSPRMAASLVEVDETVSTWPQLGGDVQLGGATVAAALRRFGRGEALPSGRIRIDLDQALDGLRPDLPPGTAGALPVSTDEAGAGRTPPEPWEAMIQAMRRAPSGGNSQPWEVRITPGGLDVHVVAARTSALDVAFRGSYVSMGAAAFNAQVAAAHHGMRASISTAVGVDREVVVSIGLTAGATPGLAALYPAMQARVTNRNAGRRQLLAPAVISQLHDHVARAGARLRVVSDKAELGALAQILSESDRIRFLTPLLHRQMMDELIWPGPAPVAVGIEVSSLGMDEADLTKLSVATRADVMALLATWDAGAALGDNTRDRVVASSAIAIITVTGESPEDYLRGGMAMQQFWIRAQQHHIGVQPISPVFLYARSAADITTLSAEMGVTLDGLQRRFDDLLGSAGETPILVLRLSDHPQPPAVRSRRLHREAVVTPDRTAGTGGKR